MMLRFYIFWNFTISRGRISFKLLRRKSPVDETVAKIQKQYDAKADFTPPISVKDEVEAAAGGHWTILAR